MWTNFYYGVVALALVFQVILLFWGKPIRKQIKLQGNYSPLGIVCNTVTAATILVVFSPLNRLSLCSSFSQSFWGNGWAGECLPERLSL